MMNKGIMLKRLILEVLEDGKIHTAEEIRDVALKKGLISDGKDTCVRNAIFKLKNENVNFVNVDKGKYMLRENPDNKHEPMFFDDAYQILCDEIRALKKFNWISCSDNELLTARKHIADLKKMGDEIRKLIV